MADNTSKRKAKGPRLYHKKSRNGCQRCRIRKVKCDEVRPVCGSCLKHGVSCGYTASTRSTAATDSSVSPAEPQRGKCLLVEADQAAAPSPVEHTESIRATSSIPDTEFTNLIPDYPETTSRRLLELRLLHHYTTALCSNFPASHNPKILVAWRDTVPQLALKHPPLLYSLLSLTALHLSKTDASLLAAHQTYLDLALQHHRQAIAALNENNLDAACLTSVFILYNSFATLQDRALEASYEPPVQLFHMSQGTYDIFKIAAQSITLRNGMAGSVARQLIMSASPDIMTSFCEKSDRVNGVLLGEAYPQGWVDGIGTLPNTTDDADVSELSDPETRAAYEESLAYIELIASAIEEGQNILLICRWVVAFPVRVPSKMIQLINEKRPRALVVLARYFKMAQHLRDIWLIGDMPWREVEAIRTSLPHAWRSLIEA